MMSCPIAGCRPGKRIHGLGKRCCYAGFGRVGLDGLRLGRCVYRGISYGAACLRQGRCVGVERRCLPLVGQGRFGGGARLILGFVMGEAGVAEQDSRYPAFRRAGMAGHASSIPFGQVSQPAELRRTLPAPAQGTCPLRIPLAAARLPHVATQAGRLLHVSRPASYSFSHFNQKRDKARPLPARGAGGRRSSAAALAERTALRARS